MQEYIKSTMMKGKTMKQKSNAVKLSIYAQTGLLHSNLRRHESTPPTDLDDLFNTKALKQQHTMEETVCMPISMPLNEHGVIPYHLLDDE